MNRHELQREISKLAGSGDIHLLERTVRLLYENCTGWHWVGIYFLVDNVLVLGPFQGKSTEHKRIPVGSGVCGSAVHRQSNMLIDDVTKLDNYLACSLEARSELVVLIRHREKIVAQFDIDSDNEGNFNQADEEFLVSLNDSVAAECARQVALLMESTKTVSHNI